MDDLDFISGFTCPHCKFESIGFVDDDRRGWTYKLPVDTNSKFTCGACGKNVPRRHWHFRDDTER